MFNTVAPEQGLIRKLPTLETYLGSFENLSNFQILMQMETIIIIIRIHNLID